MRNLGFEHEVLEKVLTWYLWCAMLTVKVDQRTKVTSPAVEVSMEAVTNYNDGSKPAEVSTTKVDLVPAIEMAGWPDVGATKDAFKWVEHHTWQKATAVFHAVAKIHHTGEWNVITSGTMVPVVKIPTRGHDSLWWVT